jgi:hypothetical protein
VKHSEVLAILRGEAPNAAHYLVLAFATEPGKTASDIGQGSGPYASALAAELVISSAMRFSGCAGAAPGKSNRTTAKMTRASIAMRGPRQDYGKALPNPTTLLRAHADEVS